MALSKLQKPAVGACPVCHMTLPSCQRRSSRRFVKALQPAPACREPES